MRIKNLNMAGQALRLRFSGKRVVFDAEGEAEVPQKDGQFLIETDGWSKVGKKAAPPPPAAVPKPEPAPPPAPQADTEHPEAPEEDAEEEGPDIEGIRTKKKAFEVANDYDVELDAESLLSEMKATLEREIYGGEE